MTVITGSFSSGRRDTRGWTYYLYYVTGLLLILPFVVPRLFVPRSWRRGRFPDVRKHPRSVFSEAHAELSNALAQVFR